MLSTKSTKKNMSTMDCLPWVSKKTGRIYSTELCSLSHPWHCIFHLPCFSHFEGILIGYIEGKLLDIWDCDWLKILFEYFPLLSKKVPETLKINIFVKRFSVTRYTDKISSFFKGSNLLKFQPSIDHRYY
jgi:hypothetical protein